MKSKVISHKRILSVFLAVLMLAAIVPAASAATRMSSAEASILDDEITVTGEIGNSPTGKNSIDHVLVLMTKRGETPSYEAGNILAMGYGQSAVSENKVSAFEVTLKPSDSLPTGSYTLTVGAADASGQITIPVSYVGAADRKAAMDVFYDEAATAEEIVAALERVSGTIASSGASEEIYNALGAEGKQLYAELALSYRERETVTQENMLTFGELSKEALVVAAIRTAKNDAQYKNAAKAMELYADIIGLDLKNEDYNKVAMADNLVKSVFSMNTDLGSAEDISLVIEAALKFARLNEMSTLAYGDYLKNNRKFFEIPADELEEMTATTKKNKYLCEAIRVGLPVYTREQMIELWEEAYKTAKKKYSDSLDDGGSGKDSSSGKGSGTVKQTFVVDPTLVRDDPLDKKVLVTEYYDDIAGYEWAFSAILSLTENGIIAGTGNKKFEPARTLKREEFMKLLVNTFSLADMTAESSFSDVSEDAWYYVYIASAEKAGITSGRGDGSFGVGDDVTREEMATLVYRAALKAGVTFNSSAGNTALYSDTDSLSAYAVSAVEALTNNGIMSGSNGSFSPKEGASRAQAAVVINNIKSHIK